MRTQIKSQCKLNTYGTLSSCFFIVGTLPSASNMILLILARASFILANIEDWDMHENIPIQIKKLMNKVVPIDLSL